MDYSQATIQLLNYKKAMLNDYLRELNEEIKDIQQELNVVVAEMARREHE